MNAPDTAAFRVRRLSTRQPDFETRFAELQHWSADTDAAIESRVAEIVQAVRDRGDDALREYTARFDGLHVADAAALEIPRAELQAALEGLPAPQRRALEQAARRVRHYHERQLEACGRGWLYRDEEGNLLGQKVTPLDRVGIYVPGGKAAYPSSVLMNALPAQVAGVGEIVMVVPTPVRADAGNAGAARGERNPLVLAAAYLAGVQRVFTVGGAQAVAALAYGTATVPRVDKITGPGNAYVASAKRRVFGQVGIDMIAGPSEILVLADGSTPADWVAMDLFSQAEHDELAQSILLCPDAGYLDEVEAAIARLIGDLPRRDTIRASLQGRGALILTRDLEEACALSNRIAPEHLEVSTREPERWEPMLRHAGAIFLGPYTSESLGDYCAGPNHVLPTSGTARFSSPLGVGDFQKRSSLIRVSQAGAQVLGPIAAELAWGEGLQAHARAAELRLAPAVAASAPAGTDAAPAQTAPAAAPAAFSVRPVTAADIDALMRLEVAPPQRALVAPVVRSLAQAAYEPAGRPLGLYWGEEAVGFLLLYDARRHPQRPAPQLYVWRLLVDARFQGRGIGRQAIEWVKQEARRMGMAEVGLSHVMAPGHAGPFYEALGFRYTGEVDEDGEHAMLLRLPDTAAGSPGMPLGDRIAASLRPDVQGLHGYAVQPSAGLVKLDTMENPHRLPLPLQQALGERLGAVALNRYPAERNETLRTRLAEHAGLPADCALMLGNGSDELISLLALACDVPGAVVLAPVPGFVMYDLSARLQGLRFVGVPLTEAFELDVPAMLAAIALHRPALVYLAYPNNPTANLWHAEAVQQVIDAMAAVGGWVVMDEAYQPFAGTDAMGWLRAHEHVLVMRTMSKFGLAGVRIGYLMGRHAVMAELEKLRPPFNVSVLNAEAALFALEHAAVYRQQALDICAERERLLQALARLPGVRPFPSQANMVLVRVPDAAARFAALKARGILVKNVSALHPLLAQCLRLTVGTHEENTLLIQAMEQTA